MAIITPTKSPQRATNTARATTSSPGQAQVTQQLPLGGGPLDRHPSLAAHTQHKAYPACGVAPPQILGIEEGHITTPHQRQKTAQQLGGF